MIQHDDHFRHVQQILTLCDARFVRIDHNEQRVVVHDLFRLMVVDKHVRLIILVVAERIHQRNDRAGRVVDDDVRFFIQRFRRTVDTDGRTERIGIRQAVSHDNDLLFRVHKLFQRVRLDAGFDSRILFHSLRFSAEILNLRTVL